MHRFGLFVALPSLAPLALVALYFTPKATFGCANRGLMALAVVVVSGLAAAFSSLQSKRARAGRRDDANWWTLTTLILLLPVALLLGPLR